jgi:hypothetical protein
MIRSPAEGKAGAGTVPPPVDPAARFCCRTERHPEIHVVTISSSRRGLVYWP